MYDFHIFYTQDDRYYSFSHFPARVITVKNNTHSDDDDDDNDNDHDDK